MAQGNEGGTRIFMGLPIMGDGVVVAVMVVVVEVIAVVVPMKSVVVRVKVISCRWW